MKKKDLYIIQCDTTGAFKVGISSNVERRVKTLKTGCPYELKVILIIKEGSHLEKDFHKRLKKYKTSKGNQEWFDLDGLHLIPDKYYELLDLEMVNTWWDESLKSKNTIKSNK